MKTVKRFLALVLALFMLIPLCNIAFAAEKPLYSEAFLTELCRTKKLRATVTSHTYDNRTDNMNFDFYYDLNTGKICADFKPQNIKAVYGDGNLTCYIMRIFYAAVPTNDIPLLKSATETIDDFQNLLNKFIDNFDMNDYNAIVTTKDVDGNVFTYEKLVAKIIGVSATFCYNSDGELCEVWFTDTLGESISFGLKDVSLDFTNDIFNPPTFCLNISFLWNLIKLFIKK